MIIQRSKRLVFTLALAGFWLGGLAPARSADILFTATGTFDWNEAYQIGFDQLGLEGASFVFTATFANPNNYQLIYDGYPFIHSLNDTMTISGSPVAGVNGTYSAGGFGVILLPTVAGQFFGDDSFDGGGGYATWVFGTNPDNQNSMRLNSLTTAVSGPTNGGLFQSSHISTMMNPVASFNVSGIIGVSFGVIDIYTIRNFQASVTVVPEPSSLILSTLAACGLGLIRYRKRVRAGYSNAAQSQR